MTLDPDALDRLCQRVREHEEPDDADRAFVRERLGLRIAAAGVGAAGVIGAAKSAAASGAAPALGASGKAAMLSGPSATLGAGGVLKAWSLAATAAWAAGGASAALVAALAVQSLQTAPPPHTPPPQASAAIAPSVVAGPSAPKRAALAPTERAARLPPEPATAPEASTRPVRVAAPVRGALPKPVQGPESPPNAPKANLAEEAASLARVQGALRDADPNLALALLDEQDRLYRTGSLGSERAAARALAWCAAGHRTRARRLAERVVAENAGSPLAERVKRKCFGTRSSP